MYKQIGAESLPRMGVASRQQLIDVFWGLSVQIHNQTEAERLQQIKAGMSGELAMATSATFNLGEEHLVLLFNASLPTLKRRKHQNKQLDSVASERLDRIAFICQQAVVVFESREAVASWMSVPNAACDNSTPVLLCVTEIGAQQVRRVLHALEWGAAV